MQTFKTLFLTTAIISTCVSFSAVAQINPTVPPEFIPTEPLPTGAAGESSIFIGRIDGRKLNSATGIGVSTAEIDKILHKYTNLGPDVTQELAQDVFDEVDEFERVLAQKLRTALLGIDTSSVEVERVDNLRLDTTPLNARISQTGTSVSASVRGLSGSARVRLDVKGIAGFVCPKFTANVRIEDIGVQSSYNIYTGNVENTDATFKVDVKRSGCSFSFGLAALAGAFGIALRDHAVVTNSRVERFATSQLNDALDDVIGDANMESFFSVMGFFDKINRYIDLAEVTAEGLPSNLTVSSSQLGDISDVLGINGNITVAVPSSQNAFREVRRTIDAAEKAVSSFPGTNIQLDMFFDNEVNNNISFIVSDVPRLERFTAMDKFENRLYIANHNGVAPNRVKYFTRQRLVGVDTTPYNALTEYVTLPREIGYGSDVLFAQSENRLINGLYSFGQTRGRPFNLDLRSQADYNLFLELFGGRTSAVPLNGTFTPPPPPPPRRTPTNPPPPPPPGEEPPCPTCDFR